MDTIWFGEMSIRRVQSIAKWLNACVCLSRFLILHDRQQDRDTVRVPKLT